MDTDTAALLVIIELRQTVAVRDARIAELEAELAGCEPTAPSS